MKLKTNSKLIHWIAIFAILMSTLAPSISQAITFKDSNKSFDVEICSVTGSKLIHVVTTDDQSNDFQFSTEHCPYCLVQSNFLPTFNTDLSFSLSQSNQLFPKWYYQSPKPLFAWLTLPSRAPPQFSWFQAKADYFWVIDFLVFWRSSHVPLAFIEGPS